MPYSLLVHFFYLDIQKLVFRKCQFEAFLNACGLLMASNEYKAVILNHFQDITSLYLVT